MGPRFHTKLHSSWSWSEEGKHGWKLCCMPVAWLTSHQDYCLYTQWKGLLKICSVVSWQKSVLVFCCCCCLSWKMWHNLSFLWLFSMGKSLSATNKPQAFDLTSLHISFWILVLQLCYLISVFLQENPRIQLLLEMQWTFFRRQMCWWLLQKNYIHVPLFLHFLQLFEWVLHLCSLISLSAGL